MTETRSAASAEVGGRRDRSHRSLRVLQQLILGYGGFLVGILTQAWWSGDDDLVFWPWSLAFVLMLGAWLVLQRRAARVDSSADRYSSS